MSRGVEGRRVAWEVWLTFNTSARVPFNDGVPVGAVHQCGAALLFDGKDLSDLSCPGCRFEVAKPEDECTPLYGEVQGQ